MRYWLYIYQLLTNKEKICQLQINGQKSKFINDYLDSLQLCFILSKELSDEAKKSIQFNDEDMDIKRIEEGYYLSNELKELNIIEFKIYGEDAGIIQNLLTSHFKSIEHQLKPKDAIWIEDSEKLKTFTNVLTTMNVHGYQYDSSKFYIFSNQYINRYYCHEHLLISTLMRNIDKITAEEICAILLLGSLNFDESMSVIPFINTLFFRSIINTYVDSFQEGDMRKLTYLTRHFQFIVKTKDINNYKDISFDVAKLLFSLREGNT